MTERSGSDTTSEQSNNQRAILLAKLAHALATPSSDAEQSLLGHQLARELHRALAEGNEALLHSAATLAQEDGLATAEVLSQNLERIASCPPVGLATADSGASVFLRGVLFVIPLAFASGAPVLSGKADNPRLTTDIGRTVLEQGFGAKHAGVIVSDYLYSPEELSMLGHCAVHMLPARMLAYVTGAHAASGGELGRRPEVVRRDRADGHMRYLLGAVIEDHDNDVSVLPQTAAATRALARMQRAWVATAAPAVARELGLDETLVRVLPPESYYEGLRVGAVALREGVFHAALREGFASAGISPRATSAIMSVLGHEKSVTEVRISLVSRLTGEVAFGITLPLNSDEEANFFLLRLGDILRDTGVFEPLADPRAYPLDTCAPGQYLPTLLDGTPVISAPYVNSSAVH